MAELTKKLGLFVVGSILVRCIIGAAGNLLDGKDIFGRKKRVEEPQKTRVDWKGNIILGTEDWKIED